MVKNIEVVSSHFTYEGGEEPSMVGVDAHGEPGCGATHAQLVLLLRLVTDWLSNFVRLTGLTGLLYSLSCKMRVADATRTSTAKEAERTIRILGARKVRRVIQWHSHIVELIVTNTAVGDGSHGRYSRQNNPLIV